jgi:hypothetical protein
VRLSWQIARQQVKPDLKLPFPRQLKSAHLVAEKVVASRASSVLFSPKETPMSVVMEEEIKRWTARRKSVLVIEIIQGKTPWSLRAASSI